MAQVRFNGVYVSRLTTTSLQGTRRLDGTEACCLGRCALRFYTDGLLLFAPRGYDMDDPFERELSAKVESDTDFIESLHRGHVDPFRGVYKANGATVTGAITGRYDRKLYFNAVVDDLLHMTCELNDSHSFEFWVLRLLQDRPAAIPFMFIDKSRLGGLFV